MHVDLPVLKRLDDILFVELVAKVLVIVGKAAGDFLLFGF